MSWTNREYNNFIDVVKDFGVSEASSDNTTAFNNAFANSGGKKIFIPAGTYKTIGAISAGAITVEAAPGAIIEHRPTNDTTDALVITGMDAGRTTIDGLTIKGMPTSHLYGRDLIRISKGDYITLRNVYLVNPKRDAFQVRPTASNQWVENLLLENVKIQFPQYVSTLSAGISASDTSLTVASSTSFPDFVPFNIIIDTEIITVGALNKTTHTLSSLTRGVEGTTAATHSSAAKVQVRQGRDGFHYEIQGTASETFKPFINQLTMLNCETRSIVRHALMLENTIANGQTANKISCLRVINNEFGAAKGPDAIVRIKGGNGIAPLENISIEDCAIENTEAERTGAGVLITGKMSGFFNLDNNIIFGNTDKALGFELFPHYFFRDVGSTAYTPVYSSHSGIYKKERTSGSLPFGGGDSSTADVHMLLDGEIIEGYVQERYGNTAFFNKFTTNGKSVPVQTSGNNVVMSVSNAYSLSISTHCVTTGNITVTLDATPFIVPLDSTLHYSQDLVATAVSKFAFTGFRALRSGTQSVAFTRADGVAPVLTVDYGTTGVTGTIDDTAKMLRVKNTHTGTNAWLEVMMNRAVKEQLS